MKATQQRGKFILRNAKRALSAALLLSPCVSGHILAEEYIVIQKSAKVFDTPNAKGYVTLNSKNEEVTLLPGMVVKSIESNNGWHIVEYSPGLRGYLSSQVTSSNHKLPSAGTYTLSNIKNIQLKAECRDNGWEATVGDKSFKGKVMGKAIVFFNEKGDPEYSLVDLGDGVKAHSYDNAVTNFL